MGNCWTDFRTKLREERRRKEDAELRAMITRPDEIIEELQEDLQSLQNQFRQHSEEIERIRTDAMLDDTDKEHQLAAPVCLRRQVSNMLKATREHLARRLAVKVDCKRLEMQIVENRLLEDTQASAKIIPGCELSKLNSSLERNGDWVSELREALEQNSTALGDAYVEASNVSPTPDGVEAEIRQLLGRGKPAKAAAASSSSITKKSVQPTNKASARSTATVAGKVATLA